MVGPTRAARRSSGVLALLILAALVAALLVAVQAGTPARSAPATAATAAAADPCGPGGNKIACENAKPGTPKDQWDINRAGDPSIQGFSTDISVNVGSRVDFKIDTDARNYEITIFRTGFYNGHGAREIARFRPSAALPQNQPQCITDVETDLYDCGNWAVSASWNVPSTAVSGVYIARLHRFDTEGESHITFIVRDDSSTSDVVFQTADPTWQAYNTYGGAYFYGGGSHGRAFKVSYNRPVLTREGIGGRDFYFANEYPMVRFLERNGYDVSYIAGVDSDRRGNLLTNHDTFLSVGHDEYWSKAQRANVEAARDAGVNLMFLAGNEVYWKTRYEPSLDASKTPYRTLTSYKETWANQKIDPSEEWTGTFRDPRYAPTSAGAGRPENRLTGTAYLANFSDLRVTVTQAEGRLRLWRNTSLAAMSGSSQQLAPHTVGYESNEDVDNGHRPPGLVRLSTTKGDVPEILQDFGNTVAPGPHEHHVTMYKAPSGALVFSAGSVQWTWGLDEVHDSPYPWEPADVRMQQAQVNLLADMGAQPTTLAPTLTPATKTTDTTKPTVTITSPAAGASQSNGANVTVSGTAADTGGRVAGVEVSTDSGTTWHAATGTTSWSYSFLQHGSGSTPIQVRAMDDSGNIGTAVTRSFNVSCGCSVYGQEVPKIQAVSDTSAAELGMRFTPVADGFVTGVRFYKGTGNSGTHIGSLWNTSGQRLAQVTFTGETSTGWQQASFSTPVAVAAGQTYVVSYRANSGRYALKSWAFSAAPTDSGPLMVDGGYGATPAGVYGVAGTFPNSSYQNSSYYVDVSFTTSDESPLIAFNHWPLADASSVALDTTVSARYSKPLVAGTAGLTLKDVNGVTVPGATAYDSTTRTVTFTPDAPLNGFVRYTATLSGTDAQGNQVSTGKTWSFTTAKPPGQPGVCPCTLFDDTKVPTLLEDADTAAVTLGVRFSSEIAGKITGVKFYKGPNNVGTHVGHLWAANGAQLASGTFTGESSSGWQQLTFSSPVSIQANTEYVASYRAPLGRYSATPNEFASANLSRSPLRVDTDSGSYTYGTGFPSSRSATNYLVDAVFEKPAPQIAVAAQDPAPGAVDIPRNTDIGIWFTNSAKPSYTMTVKHGTTTIAGTSQLQAGATAISFTPSANLPANADITVTLSGVESTDGASLPTQTWTFRTSSVTAEPSQTLFTTQLPAAQAADDSAPVELGTAFRPAKDGKVTGIRFYKATGNGGTHTGSLWSASGTRLATVTFNAETPTGWQKATLSSPVNVTAGTTYVVSYFAPQGHYSYTSQFFASDWVNGNLTAPSGNNGRYLYAAGGGFPTYSWGNANYFVDVVYVPNPPTIAVTERDPAADAIDVPRSAKPSISFSNPIASGWSMSLSQNGTPISGSASLSGDGKSLTFTPSAQLPANAELTVTVSGVVSTEGAVLPTTSWSFRTELTATMLTSMFGGQTPANAAVDDNGPVELGTAFSSSVNGTVTAIRFYKGAGNTGTHTGSIWSSDGVRLATVTFTGESASGWQTATLTTPLALIAGQTYVVSYYAPNGRYASTPSFFTSPWVSGPLTAPTANNGRYRYAAGGGFPNASHNATNYFVDVIFRSAAP